MDAQRHDKAISEYSAALSFDPASSQGIFVKRSKTYMAKGLWKDALNDADQVRSFVSRRSILVDVSLSGNKARSIISMGLRTEARGATQSRRL